MWVFLIYLLLNFSHFYTMQDLNSYLNSNKCPLCLSFFHIDTLSFKLEHFLITSIVVVTITCIVVS